MSKLKSCPFCGGDAVLGKIEEWHCSKKPTVYYGVGCTTVDCYCCDKEYYCRTEDDAITEWNKRST